MQTNTNEELLVKEIIQPLLDVIGGVDGGVAFTRLQFSLMPHIIARANIGDAKGVEALEAFEVVSNLCSALLKN
jgi:hypothetical protein